MNPTDMRIYCDDAEVFYTSRPNAIPVKVRVLDYFGATDRYMIAIPNKYREPDHIWVNRECLTHTDTSSPANSQDLIGKSVKACWGNKLTGKIEEITWDSVGNTQYNILWENGQIGWRIPRGNVALLHTTNIKENDMKVGFQKDDRVQFRHNGKAGTVVTAFDTGVHRVKYDDGSYHNESAQNLILLHSPAAKAAEGPHPMQKAVDVIDEERRKVNLQIVELQTRSAELKKAKELLIRGV